MHLKGKHDYCTCTARMKRALLLSVLAFWSIFSTPLRANTLIVVLSDTHAHNGNIKGAMLLIAQKAHDFLKQHPDGDLILVGAGDIGGMSEWTDTFGDEVWDMFAAFSGRFHLVMLAGNHETFDYNGGGPKPDEKDGNELFLDQIERFQEKVERISGAKPYLLNASMQLTETGKRIFAPNQTIALHSGKKLFFFGTELEEFFSKCYYRSKSRCLFFDRPAVDDLLSVGMRQFNIARRLKADAVIPVGHDYHTNMLALKKELDQKYASAPTNYPYPAVPWAIGAHDHILGARNGVADAGSLFRMVTIELGPNLESLNAQTDDFAQLDAARDYSWDHLTEIEREYLSTVDPLIEARREVLNRVVATTVHPLESKEITKKRETKSGELMANALAAAAYKHARMFFQVSITMMEPSNSEHRPGSEHQSPPSDSRIVVPKHAKLITVNQMTDRTRKDGMLPVIAFHNSSSYRSDFTFPVGHQLTYGEVWQMYAFPGHAQVVLVTVDETLELYNALRASRYGADETFTPQVSSNVVLTDNSGRVDRLMPTRLSVYDGDELKPRGSASKLWLALDPFTARNGYRNTVIKNILKSKKRVWLPPMADTHSQIVQKFIPKLVVKKDCLRALNELAARAVHGDKYAERVVKRRRELGLY